MNNKYVFAVVGLVVGLVVGFYAFSGGTNLQGITPSTKTLDSQDLANELSLIAAPLQAIQQFISVTTTTASLSAFGTSTDLKFTTFTVTSTVGDNILVAAN